MIDKSLIGRNSPIGAVEIKDKDRDDRCVVVDNHLASKELVLTPDMIYHPQEGMTNFQIPFDGSIDVLDLKTWKTKRCTQWKDRNEEFEMILSLLFKGDKQFRFNGDGSVSLEFKTPVKANTCSLASAIGSIYLGNFSFMGVGYNDLIYGQNLSLNSYHIKVDWFTPELIYCDFSFKDMTELTKISLTKDEHFDHGLVYISYAKDLRPYLGQNILYRRSRTDGDTLSPGEERSLYFHYISRKIYGLRVQTFANDESNKIIVQKAGVDWLEITGSQNKTIRFEPIIADGLGMKIVASSDNVGDIIVSNFVFLGEPNV